ncbi:hypothetical protein C4D60_Mb01t09630 [Musa balbisiana]|uniref:Magnesium transporter n=1 Tax=Musa balbisiana TaxID=52838 RepID=A0A4S8JN27_MUSBA|nr:hypothetical protein C4D60_Mb01t09630 [Musa balbisiana]
MAPADTASAGSWVESYTGMSSDNIKGLVLALSSSFFIGASFIVKKKGLKKAGASGVRAGAGGYSYFAVLAHIILRERLHIFGILGCALCVVGSTTIVLHAPQEREIESVTEVWDLATEPAFLFYAATVLLAAFILIFHFVPKYGQTHIMVYIGVCSLVGSLSVMSVKALGIALKLTFSGMNQLAYSQTWVFTIIVIVCILTQMNYLNKALDTFNTAVVSPIYYVMFTSLTILASVIMFKDWDRQNPTQIVTEMCGFVTILSGTFLLHRTKDMADGLSPSMSGRLPKHTDEDGYSLEGVPLRSQDSFRGKRRAREKTDHRPQAMMSSTLPTGPLDPSLLTTLFIILVPLSLLLLLLQVKRNSRGHPPCPPRLPLIGNLHQLGPLPHRSLHALSQQHGPLMQLRLGQVPVLVVSSPDAAREVLRNQDHACAGRPALKAARILLYGCKDLAFAPYGDYWKQLRKICSVHLLSPKRVQSYRLMREEEVESMMGKISSQASASANVIDLSEVLYSFTNDVLCRVVSGKFTGEEGRNRLFSELVGENSVLLSKIYVGDYFPWLGWLDMFFGSVARCNKNKARWDKLLDEVIKEHAVRSAKHGGEENDGEEKDFVDVLLSLQKDAAMDFVLTTEHIKALLEDMFGAGTDTSYITLEWAMAELIKSPRAMRKLQDEVRRGRGSGEGLVREEEVSQMAYLKAVVKEVLRLHPPAPLLLPRELLEDCSIQGYRIPKKARIFVNAWAMGRDPRSWESPEEFRPERFADGALDFTGNDARYVPFGAGRRICPAQNFAVAALELALANLVSRFDWELPGGLTREELQMNEAPGIVTQRQGRLHLVAKPWGA